MSSVHEKLTCSRRATTLLFLNFGWMVGCWVSSIPDVKDAFHLNAAQLGILIFCSGIGSLLTAIPMGKLVELQGPRQVARWSGMVAAICNALLPQLASHQVKPYLYLLSVSCITSGGGTAINTRAAELELLWGKPLMSSFHAAFSLGGLLGSCTYAACLSVRLTWPTLFPALCAIGAIVQLCGTAFMDVGLKEVPAKVAVTGIQMSDSTLWRHLDPFVLCLGCVCFLTMMTEGAIGDWTALYLRVEEFVPENVAPLGYAFYAAAMGLMRVCGDLLIHFFGRTTVFRVGAMTALVGILTFLSIPNFYVDLIALVAIGIGMSNMMPILISTCSRQSSEGNAGVAIAILSVMGQCGIMAGPALIGLVSHYVGSLRFGLCTLICTTLIISLATPLIEETKLVEHGDEYNVMTSEEI